MTRSTGWVTCGLLIASLAGGRGLEGQQTAPTLRVNAMELQVAGRVQTQFNTTSVDGEPASEMILRRVRMEMTVRVNPVVSGKLAPDFAGDRVTLKDAYLKLDFSPAIQLLTGKAYRPFSLLEQTSSTRILPIERGLSVRGVDALDEYELVHDLQYSDRDIGVQLMGAPVGAPLGLSYAAGVFAGPLARRTGSAATYQYVARVTARPLPSMTVGAAVSNRAFAARRDSTSFDIERGTAFEIDAEIGTYAPGFHALGELTIGDYDALENSRFLGAQAWLAYRTTAVGRVVSAVEPLLRFSHASVDELDEIGGTLFTPGVNVYFGGLNRLMFNYDFWSPGTGSAQGGFKAQAQLAF